MGEKSVWSQKCNNTCTFDTIAALLISLRRQCMWNFFKRLHDSLIQNLEWVCQAQFCQLHWGSPIGLSSLLKDEPVGYIMHEWLDIRTKFGE